METISIVTIAYNSEAVIARTIESVLAQGYRPLEYRIVDGASTDSTVLVAESYRERMEQAGIEFYVDSEPDRGIYDAMNKGIARAAGTVIGLLNSGDWYEPYALQAAADAFEEKKCDLLFGNIRLHRADRNFFHGRTLVKKARLRRFQTSRDWNHPTMFVRAGLYRENPFPCRGIHDDYGFYLKMVKAGVRIITLDRVLANFQMGGASNRKSLKAAKGRIRDRYLWCYRANGYSRWYLIECIATEAAKWIVG